VRIFGGLRLNTKKVKVLQIMVQLPSMIKIYFPIVTCYSPQLFSIHTTMVLLRQKKVSIQYY